MLDSSSLFNARASFAPNADVYTDLNGLNAIKQQGRIADEQALRKVAEQFESMFVNMMLKSMRAANKVFAEDGLLNSFETDMHQQMLDNQLSVSLTQGRGTGLADVFFQQLQQQFLRSDVQGTADRFNKQIQRSRNMPFISNTAPLPEDATLPGAANSVAAAVPTEGSKAQETRTIADKLFKTPVEFVKRLAPQLEQAAQSLGLDVRAMLAQAALETGWGKRVIENANGESTFNLFGIKADNSWQGDSVRVSTLEYENLQAKRKMDDFRAYNSFAESAADFVQFLRSNPRYQQALDMTDNVGKFWHELQNAGYATDPQYANKLQQIYRMIDVDDALGD